MSVGIGHINTLLRLAEAGQVVWKPMQTPKPDAMRAFEGTADGYLVNVAQANIEDPAHPELPQGIVHEGMLVATKAGFMVVHLPKDAANALYHRAAATQN